MDNHRRTVQLVLAAAFQAAALELLVITPGG